MKIKKILGLLLCISLLVGCTNSSETLSNNDIMTKTNSNLITESPVFVVEQNNNIPYFTDEEKTNTEAFEKYSDLDYLGRCGAAYANICPVIMPTEERGEIGQIKPTGWHTIKYDIVEGKYLYNRCHLIAYCLSGENANEKNLITGTRYFNVNGMLPYETKVAQYVESTGNHVLYRVIPVYEDDNLVAKGVQMEAWSVEDSGVGICFNVFVYNIQPGITIDYATGESWLTENINELPTTEINNNKSVEVTYIINSNTKKFHYSDCESIADIKSQNKKEYNGTRKDLIKQGYEPCGRCKP